MRGACCAAKKEETPRSLTQGLYDTREGTVTGRKFKKATTYTPSIYRLGFFFIAVEERELPIFNCVLLKTTHALGPLFRSIGRVANSTRIF